MPKIISIDIETTGLNEKTCQIIEIGAVIDDILEPMAVPPEFHCYVDYPVYSGEPYALSMHSHIFHDIATKKDGHRYEKDTDIGPLFAHWLNQNYRLNDDGGKWTVTGKNYSGFDDRFLRLLTGWGGGLHHRVLDPGSLYYEPTVDKCLPDTKECMRRAGLKGEVAHTALEDAKDVMKLVQKYYQE